MPLDWFHLGLEEKAQAILDDIEGLTDAEILLLLEEWRGLDYSPLDSDSWLSELTRMAADKIAAKAGAPTARERARSRLKRAGTIE